MNGQVDSETDRKRQWLDEYIQALPAAIRPSGADQRFLQACGAAYRNRWTAKQIARQVAGRSYANALNPPLIAIWNLENLGARPPGVVADRPAHASGCLICAPGQTCEDPITERTRPDWAAERLELMRTLMSSPGIPEDVREQMMSDLIARQRVAS